MAEPNLYLGSLSLELTPCNSIGLTIRWHYLSLINSCLQLSPQPQRTTEKEQQCYFATEKENIGGKADLGERNNSVWDKWILRCCDFIYIVYRAWITKDGLPHSANKQMVKALVMD